MSEITKLVKVDPLPSCRFTYREAFKWEKVKWFLDCGFAPDGTVREIFLTPRGSAAMAPTMADASIAISFLLQRGMSVSEFLRKLTSLPTDEELDGKTPLTERAAYSLIGDAVRRAVRIEIEHKADALAVYEQVRRK